MPKPETIRVKLMPKQYEFVFSDAMQILYSGAVRAGKSRALCYRALRKASQSPKARVGLCRKTLVALKATTLRTLLEPDGDLDPVLPPNTYKHSVSPGKEKVMLHGGGEIIYFGCDSPEKIGSLTLSEVLVDEGIELDVDEWNMLTTRCSLQFTLPNGKKNKRSIATATNPGAPSHFLHELFFKQTAAKYKRHVINTSSLENWHLPRDYVEDNLAHLPLVARKRYLHGIWAAFEGAVYPQFSPEGHVFHWSGPWDFYIAGVDWGFSHRTAVRIHGVMQKGLPRPISHVVSEYYEVGMSRTELVEMCVETRNLFPGCLFVVDPANPDIVKDMQSSGLSAKLANNDVIPGIRTAGTMLNDVQGGRPRLSFEPGLQGTDEYMSYSWKEGAVREQPIKKNDDACDADRYAVMEIDAGARVGRLVPLRGRSKDDMLKRQRLEALGVAKLRGCGPEVDVSDERWWSN
jgi:phage terminase large subunit